MSKFITVLTPDYFKPMPATERWHRWHDISNPRVRVLSKTPNPWHQPVIVIPQTSAYKSDRTKYYGALEFKVLLPEKQEQFPVAIFKRECLKAHFSYAQAALFTAHFPTENHLRWLIYQFIPPQKQLYLIRGASGSGKTTLGHILAINNVISADDFPELYQKGEYQNQYQEQSHAWCLKETELRLLTGSPVAVANTFSRRFHLQPYLELARRYGYQTTIIVCEGNYGNVHNVSEEIRGRQLATFEPLETLNLEALEIRLHDALKRGVATPEQLHILIERLQEQFPPSHSNKKQVLIAPTSTVSITNVNARDFNAGEINENKTNDERIAESIALVTEAVDFLKKNGQWHQTLTKRNRINLIQDYTRQKYNRTISSGTLYRDWCKLIWS